MQHLTKPANLTSASCLLFCKKEAKKIHLAPAVSGGVRTARKLSTDENTGRNII